MLSIGLAGKTVGPELGVSLPSQQCLALPRTHLNVVWLWQRHENSTPVLCGHCHFSASQEGQLLCLLAASRPQVSGFFCLRASSEVFSLFSPRATGWEDNPKGQPSIVENGPSPYLPCFLAPSWAPIAYSGNEREHFVSLVSHYPLHPRGTAPRQGVPFKLPSWRSSAQLLLSGNLTQRQLPLDSWYRLLVAEGELEGAVSLLWQAHSRV